MDLPRKAQSRGPKLKPFTDLNLIKIKEHHPPVDYSIVKPLDKMRTYAGETEQHEIRDMVYFKQTGEYPRSVYNPKFTQIEHKKRHNFLTRAESYKILDEEMSVLTRSKLSYRDTRLKEWKIIPFQDEMAEIMRVLHFEDGKHLNITRSRKRARAFGIFWRNYWDDIEIYASQCICHGLVGRKNKIKIK